MAEPITSAWVTAKNAMHNIAPMVWLFHVDVNGTFGVRIAGYDAQISFGGNLWYPYPVAVSAIERNAEGNLPFLDLTVGAAARELNPFLELGGFLDREVRLYMVNTADLTDALDYGRWVVVDAVLDSGSVVFRLGHYNLLDAPLPSRRQSRSRCDNVYGGVECGYDTSIPNSVAGTYPSFDPTTCDLTLDGSNGCRVHGHNEVANGRPRLHPRRFGGEPGIPKGIARV